MLMLFNGHELQVSMRYFVASLVHPALKSNGKECRVQKYKGIGRMLFPQLFPIPSRNV